MTPQSSVRRIHRFLTQLFFLAAIVTATAPAPAHAASFWDHVQATFVDAFDETGLAILAAGAIGTVVAANNDVPMRDAWVNQQRMSSSESAFGDFWGQGYAEVAIAGAQLIWDRQNGIVDAEGLGESFVVLEALKYSTGRLRPDGSNNLSFPSGHTTISFVSATNVAIAYPWYAGVPAYGLAVFTGLSRVADNKHWLSDVVAGATLGSFFGRAGFKHHFGVSPLVINDGGDGFGLVATWRFN